MVIKVKPIEGDISIVSFDDPKWGLELESVGRARTAVRIEQDEDNGSRVPEQRRNRPFGFCSTWTSTVSDAVGITGIKFIVSSNFSLFRRLVWTVALLGGMTAASYQIIDRAVFFAGNPKSVDVEIEYTEPMTFPAVTVCNTNQFRNQQGALEQHPFGQFLSAYYYGENLTSFIPTLRGANTTALYYDFAHPMEFTGMLSLSSFGGRGPLVPANFTSVLTKHGVCYTFNGGLNGQELKQQKVAGAAHGLVLQLSIEQYYHFFSRTASGAGVYVAVHGQDEIPDIDSMGVGVPAGRDGKISVRKKTTMRKDDGCYEKELKYSKNYTTSMCHLECLIEIVNRICGCVEPYMAVISQLRVCDPIETFTCAHHQAANPSNVGQCDCPLPCSTTKYTTSASYTAFPGKFYSARLAERYSTPEFTLPENLYQENLVQLHVFYEELSTEHLEQHSAYTFFAFLCDIGGALGLWLGGSILTFVEILDHLTHTSVARGSSPYRHV
ncbi:acid-sensing ion channel 1C-like isoform X1 [Patiria miniata]|uniref:Uncharacterized protein n=1 Tax=Patiria miniata TaxID=46514 RepID=A0A914B088_PATMI|nr:acid-sensing ion channel 1C-like isoform X1 [Patiria miniata]